MFALPDGETGPRAAWAGYERERLVRPHPDIETVTVPESAKGDSAPCRQDAEFRLRPGVRELRFESWPRIDDAITPVPSVPRVACGRRDSGDLRFQAGLPFPLSGLSGFKENFAADYPIASRGYEDCVRAAQRCSQRTDPSQAAALPMRLVSPDRHCSGCADALIMAGLPVWWDSRHSERMGNIPSSTKALPLAHQELLCCRRPPAAPPTRPRPHPGIR